MSSLKRRRTLRTNALSEEEVFFHGNIRDVRKMVVEHSPFPWPLITATSSVPRVRGGDLSEAAHGKLRIDCSAYECNWRPIS